MEIINLALPGCILLKLDYFSDDRGVFVKTFNRELFKETGLFIFQMEEEFFKALNSIPEEDGCYLLGATVLCKYKQKLTKRWERVKSIKTDNWGTTCLLFTRKSLKRILDYIHKNKINEPIDHTIKIVYGKSLYYWNDNISENGMFIGLFEQYETYCDKRISVIDSI